MLVLFLAIICIRSLTEGATPKDLLAHPNWKMLNRMNNCGLSSSKRIIGGHEASLGQFPWIARISRKYRKGNQTRARLCGGSIISELHVLTAAHCLKQSEYRPDLVDVTLGEHNIKTRMDCLEGVCAPSVKRFHAHKLLIHPNFDSRNYDNDIGIIRLASPIIFNTYIQPICLPTYDLFFTDTFYDFKYAEVAGWGVEDINGQRIKSDVLNFLITPIMPLSNCSSRWQRLITNKQLCAGGVEGSNSCKGDSGGPLMLPEAVDGPPQYYLVGVLSHGPQECATVIPAVYTRVSSYIPWILDNL